MSELLLPTKLAAPRLHSGFITRPHLIARLQSGLERQLTLISAPAGFGKTTLLAEWASREESDPSPSPPHFGWLSLDEQDNDPARFLAYLVAALQLAAPVVAHSAVPRLESTLPVPTETILTLLIADLSQLEDKLVLILDDCHHIGNPAVFGALAFLLEHGPPQLHLVLATRSDPPLALARWRVRAELNELRAADLPFTEGEIRDVLQHTVGRPLAAHTVELLARRTEGWPAGVQLAALSLRGLEPAAVAQFADDFDGSDRHVLSYLTEEVLQRQPPVLQRFLLQTTLLPRLNASLCDALTEIESWNVPPSDWAAVTEGPVHSQPLLDYLASNNLFLTPLDGAGRWFRYHRLFAETLQARLQETEPELIPDLHRRAGRWYAAHGYTEQAIQHALAAGDSEMTADLIEAAADRLWQQGHLGLLLSWFGALPEATLGQRPALCVLHAWLLFLHDRWPEASQKIHLAGQLLAALPRDEPAIQQQRGRWAAVQGAMAAHRRDAAAAVTWMEIALETLPMADTQWRQVALIGLGLAQLADGHALSALSTLREAALVCEAYQDTYLAFSAWWHQAEACWAQGRLREMGDCLHHLALLAEQDVGDSLALAANAAVGWAMLAYERNELGQAEQLLQTALPQIWPGGQPRIALQAYLTRARLAGLRGDAAQAQQELDTALQLVHRFDLTAERLIVAATAARLLVAQGRYPEAHWWLEKEGVNPQLAPLFQHEVGLLALVRLYLAEGRAEEGGRILSRMLPPAELAGRSGSLLEIFLLQALTLARRQQPERALAALSRALSLAEPEQFSRIFLDEGRPLYRLLQQVSPRTPYVAHLLAQMAENPGTTTPLDPLTARELEVLQLVAEGASNQAVAEQLVISVGTVKGHLNHILSKLDAQNRTQAVARARDLGLL